MTKSDVLAKLELFKDRMIEIGLSDEGKVLYSGIDGHWIFTEGDNLVYVRANITGALNGVGRSDPHVNPFVIEYIPFDIVNYVKSYIPNDAGSIESDLEGLTVVGTSKSFDDIIKEIESNSIRKSSSPSGNLNVHDVAPGGFYGKFMGTAISTEKGGLPKYLNSVLTD